MGKVYIGVTAVGGHKLWGGGWKEGCGVRWFGEWVSGGRLTAGGGEVAGRACPAPTDCYFRQRGFGGTPEFKVEEGAGALRTKSNTAFV